MSRTSSGAAVVALWALVGTGCIATDYPVILDTRGADDAAVLHGQYDQAFVIPSAQVASIWADGSDEIFTLVSQDWKGDQTLKTYNNFDPTSALLFLDQTYCDPVRNASCVLVTAVNPNSVDDKIFDYTWDPSCDGFRSLGKVVAYSSRIGECGSGLWSDKQGLAQEFSELARATLRGEPVYLVPIDSSVASFRITSDDGAVTEAPIFGRYNAYLTEKLQLALPMSPNFRYQKRWLKNWAAEHGARMTIDVTYGAVSGSFEAKLFEEGVNGPF